MFRSEHQQTNVFPSRVLIMNIQNSTHGVSKPTTASPINKVTANPIDKQVPADAPKQLKLTDRVELSGMKSILQSLKAGKDFRADKVAQVRAQIEAGTYETDEKLTIAADK